VSASLQTVHVRINDAATGRPTPVRLRFSNPAGEYFPPLGRLAAFPTDIGFDVGGNVLIGHEAHAYIDGTCEIRLPPGPLRVEINKGPEYLPVVSEFTLTPGKLALRFEIRRWIDMRAARWFSGDTCCHFLTPHAALLEAAAEDVAVVNLLAEECLTYDQQGNQYTSLPNILAFSGQVPALASPDHLVVVNTLNLHWDLGRVLLLNCHRVVHPLTAGRPNGLGDWSIADWCDQCHRKGGLVVGDGFFGHDRGPPKGELLADLILSKLDALQQSEFENPEADAELGQTSILQEWHRLLDCGFRIPLVGGSDKQCNLDILGAPRTYARLGLGEEFTYRNWIEAVRAGRTFVTNGPLLLFTVNGQDPGAVIHLTSADETIRVQAAVQSQVPLRRLEVVANNKVVAGVAPSDSPTTALVEADVLLPRGGWVMARCWGEYDDRMEQWFAAQTSPVYVQVGSRTPYMDPTALAEVLAWLDGMTIWLSTEARCQNDQQRQRFAEIFQGARDILLQRGG
jgi:hypothetical protein